MTWSIHDEALSRLFPGAPVQILQLMEHGDLMQIVPNWIDLLIQSYDDCHPWLCSENRCRRAWLLVLAAYDDQVEAQAVRETLDKMTSGYDEAVK